MSSIPRDAVRKRKQDDAAGRAARAAGYQRELAVRCWTRDGLLDEIRAAAVDVIARALNDEQLWYTRGKMQRLHSSRKWYLLGGRRKIVVAIAPIDMPELNDTHAYVSEKGELFFSRRLSRQTYNWTNMQPPEEAFPIHHSIDDMDRDIADLRRILGGFQWRSKAH